MGVVSISSVTHTSVTKALKQGPAPSTHLYIPTPTCTLTLPLLGFFPFTILTWGQPRSVAFLFFYGKSQDDCSPAAYDKEKGCFVLSAWWKTEP